MSALPLEYLDPSFLLRYLPPGADSEFRATSNFWRAFSLVHPDPDLSHPPDWEQQLYLRVSLEYVNELDLPGKALVILQEAA
jgi:hypothetical protein